MEYSQCVRLVRFFQRKVTDAGAQVHQTREDTLDENHHRFTKSTLHLTYTEAHGFFPYMKPAYDDLDPLLYRFRVRCCTEHQSI